jgi:uncharacterized protein (TIRG00374 family)
MRLEKKHSLRLLQAAISIAIVYYLLQLVDWQAVEQLLVSGILPRLWPGPLILLLGLLLAAERWRAVLGFFGLGLRRGEAFMLYLIGNFYSVLLPGVLGGDVVRAAMCRTKTGGTAATVLASVGIERGLGLWGVTLIGTFGALAVVLQMPVSFDVAALLLSPLMAVGIPLVVWLAYVAANRVGPLKTGTGLVGKAMDMVRQFAGRVREFPAGLAARTLLFSTAFQASEIFIYFYFGHVMQIDVPFFFYLFVIPLVYLATVLPISLGGIGVREGVLVWFLSIAGIPASDAVLLAFLVYLNRVLVGVIGGGVQAVYRINQ